MLVKMFYRKPMSSTELETRFLSLRFWLLRCVLPCAITLAGLIVFLRVFIESPHHRDQTALILAFSMVYFTLFRAGHLFMIRSMHLDLKHTYGNAYEVRLQKLPRDLQRKNLGFTLARIKRDLIDRKR